MQGELPDGYSARGPSLGDFEAVLALIRTCEAADEGEAEMTADDLRGSWERARFELENDAWIVTAPDGRLAGYVDVWAREPGARFVFDGYVHPDFCGHGVGTFLLRSAEGRARDQGGSVASTIVFSKNEAACRLLTTEGYTLAMHYLR